jgi:hypothetical protein
MGWIQFDHEDFLRCASCMEKRINTPEEASEEMAEHLKQGGRLS